NSSTIRNTSLSLINTETNTTLLTRTISDIQSAGRVEFNCSCFLYAGTFRFLLKQTSITAASHANDTQDISAQSTTWWWSSELQVQWPTFHIAVERAGNHSGSFQVGIATNEHFQACSRGIDAALFLEVSYIEYNQIGRISIDKVQARTRHPIKPLRSQSVELSCAFPFTERDFIRVALRSPHEAQDVKSSGPLYLSRIFSYKLLVENTNAYRSGCEGTMTVKLITPPCAHINGKVLLYKDAALMGLGPEEPSSPPLAFNWLTQGENETEFNCSVFYTGRNKYCFRFVLNFSRSPSPAQTCLVVHRSAESWGSWLPWSVCSVSCGEGVRERVRECLLPSGVGGMQCTGMVKEQSLCSLEDCVVLPTPSPSLTPGAVGLAPLGGNMVVVAGISLCLAVILATVLVTLWRKLCKTPQCSSVRRGSMHSPGGRKLSDEASIFGHSLQRPSLSDGHGQPGGIAVGVAQKDRPSLGQLLSQTPVIPLSQDPERYHLAQQQLKEMKKKGLKEATQMYHVSSSPVHDTVGFMVERSGFAGLRGGGVDAGKANSFNTNPNFRRTSSFNDTKPQPRSSGHCRPFRERSLTQVNYPALFMRSYDRQRSGEAGGGEGISGIGGPAARPASLSVDRAERAEQNWNRRGPSPIQRNILARKLKDAQSYSGVKGRQRSSTFSVSASEQRKGRCHSLPMSGGYGSSGVPPYRLSEAEQRMLDLDLSSAYVGEEV
uniref:Thrombospondin, type I, domain containing 1 n=1 Tax=Cyclopterus lumpus TaxID=8103 RepID=A0A8C2XS46_CYCLU